VAYCFSDDQSKTPGARNTETTSLIQGKYRLEIFLKNNSPLGFLQTEINDEYSSPNVVEGAMNYAKSGKRKNGQLRPHKE